MNVSNCKLYLGTFVEIRKPNPNRTWYMHVFVLNFLIERDENLSAMMNNDDSTVQYMVLEINSDNEKTMKNQKIYIRTLN